MLEALDYGFFQRALAAGLLAAVACGTVGALVVVKDMASVSGGLAHAAFGGLGLAYVMGLDPSLGAMVFALACGALLAWAHQRRYGGLDSLIAMIWAFGMALGVLLISSTPRAVPELHGFLFGSLLFTTSGYVKLVIVLDAVVLIVTTLMFDELQAVCFDEDFARVVGVPVGLVLQVFFAMVSLAVVCLIRVVGVVLVIALLTIPAMVARHWTRTLAGAMAMATGLGMVCTVLGLFGSYEASRAFNWNLPTGPLTVMVAVAMFLISSALRATRGGRSGYRVLTER